MWDIVQLNSNGFNLRFIAQSLHVAPTKSKDIGCNYLHGVMLQKNTCSTPNIQPPLPRNFGEKNNWYFTRVGVSEKDS